MRSKLLLLLLALTLVATPIAAQSTTTTTPTEAPPDGRQVDGELWILNAERVDDGVRVTLLSTSETSRNLLVRQTVTEGKTQRFRTDTVDVDPGRQTVMVDTIDDRAELSLSTVQSRETGTAQLVDPGGGGPIIGGPWTWTDSALVGAVVALGITATVLYRAVLDRVGERGREVLAG